MIKDTFGKENGITEEDLRKLIGTFQETSLAECKTIARGSKISYDGIIKSVIGFLNKLDGSGGLLIVGLSAQNGTIDGIQPINSEKFRQGPMRSKILNDVASIPGGVEKFSLDVLEVLVGGGWVELVEVHKVDPNAVFYSKSQNTSYIRRGDSTEPLDIGELFRLALIRSYPVVYLDLKLKNSTLNSQIQHESLRSSDQNSSTERSYTYMVEIFIGNSGVMPGTNIEIGLGFYMIEGSRNVSIENMVGLEETNKIPPYFRQYERYLHPNNSKPIYPGINFKLGGFSLKAEYGSKIGIRADLFEQHGYTSRIFEIYNGNLNSKKPDFHSYLNL
ncbi:MAG: ATP-binding protein [Candidatus Thermoplasmatota archaeon]|nr:ATP-binding protein [Candidatus Thermoplasmatota archaeon]